VFAAVAATVEIFGAEPSRLPRHNKWKRFVRNSADNGRMGVGSFTVCVSWKASVDFVNQLILYI
jgi:hypothetical protein